MKKLISLLAASVLGAQLASSAPAGEIHDAAARGDTAAIEKLLAANKALIEDKAQWANDEEGWGLVGTPLHIAAIYGQTDAVKLLVAKGANVNALDGEKFTPLALAAYLGRRETVAFLLKTNGVDVQAVTNEKKTALHLAIEGFPMGEPVPLETRAAVCEMLLDGGANPNAFDGNQNAPLHLAVSLEIPAVVKVLLAKGANVNAKDAQGRTPLAIAVENGLDEITEILKKAGAK